MTVTRRCRPSRILQSRSSSRTLHYFTLLSVLHTSAPQATLLHLIAVKLACSGFVGNSCWLPCHFWQHGLYRSVRPDYVILYIYSSCQYSGSTVLLRNLDNTVLCLHPIHFSCFFSKLCTIWCIDSVIDRGFAATSTVCAIAKLASTVVNLTRLSALDLQKIKSTDCS